MENKGLWSILMVVCAFIIFSSVVHAAPIPIRVDEVRVDDYVLNPNDVTLLDIQRGQEVPVDIKLTGLNDTKNVEVEVFISGFEYNDIQPLSDATRVFDVDANVSYVKRMRLKISDDVQEDSYKIRVVVSDRFSDQIIQTYNVKLDVPRHSLRLEDVIFSPSDSLVAGKALLGTVRLQNMGEKVENDIKVTISIPELGIQASDYIDEIRVGDEEQSEEIFLKIPDNAKSGKYLVNVDVQFQQLHDKLTAQKQITIIGKEDSSDASKDVPKALISVDSSSGNVKIGKSIIFPVSVQNNYPTSKVVIVTAAGTDSFADVFVSPSSTVVLDGKETKVFNVEVTPYEDATVGTKVFRVNVKVGDAISKEIPLSVTISESDNAWMGTLKVVLEWLLIIFVIVLVVIGVALAFRQRADKDGELSQMQTYY